MAVCFERPWWNRLIAEREEIEEQASLEPRPQRSSLPCLRDVLGLSFAFCSRELLKLPLAHRFIHLLRGALKLAGTSLPAPGSERCARRLLLGSRFSWH